jgi:NAD(P)-dependent dehydrogenase (short-subunit alcohol dehydrogenase family)
MSHTCPVCGFPKLNKPPRSLTGGASYEICPLCGFEHGVDDEDKGQSYAAARDAWKRGGMQWASKGQPQPANWNPEKQLAAVTPGKGAKFIVLTGCTRGCGLALTEWLIAQGHTVAGCARSGDGVSAMRETFGTPHDFTALDVSDDHAVMRWAARLVITHGAPDLLVNNAAVIARNAPLWKVPPEEIAATLNVNVTGTVNTIRHFAPTMIARGRGVIVNFSSGWGHSTSPDVAIYCASKYAIEGLTMAFAQELPEGVAAIALNPGIIDTEMLRSCFGRSASGCPKPADWVKRAGPFILALGTKDSGRSLDVR